MTTLRLLADDFTGAMDSAVRFVPLTGPVPVRWDSAGTGSFAFDLGTRECDGASAMERAAAAAPMLRGADVAYLKCDSLLRGHAAEELHACMTVGGFVRGVVAPAFPAQRRWTRGGRQYAGLGGERVGPDVAAQLATLGERVTLCRPGDAVPDGISLWDAATEDDLARIVAGVRRADATPTLWCGSAGLAGALAGQAPPAVGWLRRPILALLGSDHPVTRLQLAQAQDWHHRLNGDDIAALAARLIAQGAAAVSVALPEGLTRDHAATRIAAAFGALPAALPAPATLFVTGGETLRALCEAAGATAVTVFGEVAPGVPAAHLQGGPWDGVTIVAKSGAFGEEMLLRDLLATAL